MLKYIQKPTLDLINMSSLVLIDINVKYICSQLKHADLGLAQSIFNIFNIQVSVLRTSAVVWKIKTAPLKRGSQNHFFSALFKKESAT